MTVTQTVVSKPQIQIKRVYNHHIHKIWSALTEPAALAEWLMKTNDFALKVGHKFQFQDKPQGGWDGIVNCEILSVDQPNSLSYTWQASSMKNPTIVTWTLKAISAKETIVTLSHNGFEGFSGWVTQQILNFGWKGMLKKKLTKHLTK